MLNVKGAALWQRWGVSLVVLLLGALLSVLATRAMLQTNQEQLKSRLQLLGGERMALIATQVRALATEMRGLQRFFSFSDEVSRREFAGFNHHALEHIVGIAWAPRVSHIQRDSHEQTQRDEGLRGYQILDLNKDDQWSPAALRDEYFPLTYISSLNYDNAAMGFNMASHPVLYALLKRARDSGEPALSNLLSLVGLDKQAQAQLLVSPVYFGGKVPESLQARRQQLRGFLIMTVSLQSVLRRLLNDETFNGLTVGVKDAQQANAPLLASYPQPLPKALSELGQVHSMVPLADRQLDVSIEALPSFVATYQDARVVWVPWLGALLTLMTTLLVWVLSNQRFTAMSLVRSRTQELELRSAQVAGLEARWRAALDSAGDGIWEWDLSAHVLSFCDRYLGRLGYTASEFGTREEDWLVRVHEDDRERCQACVRQHVRGETNTLMMEYRLQNHAGEYLWVMDRGQVISRNEQGRALRMIGTQTDIDGLKSIQRRAEDSQRYLQSVLDAATEVAIMATDIHGRFTLFNAGAERLFGYKANDVVNRETPLLLHDPLQIKAMSEDLQARGLGHYEGFAALVAQVRLGEVEARDWRMRHKNGQWRDISLRITAIRNHQGGLTGFLGIAVDVTERREVQRQLKAHDERLRKLASQVPGALFQYRMDLEGSVEFVFISDGAYKLLDLDPAHGPLEAASLFTRIHRDDKVRVQASIRQTYEQRASAWHDEFRILTHAGEVLWVRGEARTESRRDGSFIWYGYLTDVSVQKKLEAELRQLTITDPLTKAFNRRFFDEQGRLEIHRAERYRTPLSLLMWDIDHFKAINDRYGHEWGDRVLQQFVEQFSARLRQSDYLCRLGGEEFAVLLPQTDLSAARQLADDLLALCEEARLPRVGKVTASFAVVAWQSGESLAQVFNRADALLYQAKAEGRACVRG